MKNIKKGGVFMAQQDILMINVVDQSVRPGYPINISIINQANPVKNYVATASQIRYLIQIPSYYVTDSTNNKAITGRNFYKYFPDLNPYGGGGGGSITIDNFPTEGSGNAVSSGGTYSFVNSSVSTNTANFIGTFSSVADLEAYSGTVTNNDYAFVIGIDENGNTKYDRYKYTDATDPASWEYEYALNNSSFTAAEWATIQSGFTAADKTKYDGYEAIINSKPGLIESSGGEIFNTYSGDVKNSAYDRAHAEGFNTTASGLASHSEGIGTKATGDQSHAEGKNTTASGYVSHTEGENTKATNWYAHAEGYNTTAEGRGSHAEGSNTKATNVFSHAEGLGTTASGENSHAEGLGATASGTGSHAEGAGTAASGFSSHAEGAGTAASDSQAHAEGQNSKALGVCSHAEGNNTTAKGQSQHAEGEYNVVDESVSSSNPRGTFAHIIGNGTSDSNRSNAYAIGWDGKIYQPSDPNADPNGVYLSAKANKATTIAGYGITDAKFTPSTGTIQLGSNTLVPVTTIQINGTTQTNTNGTVNLPAYPTTLPASDTTNTYNPSGTVPVSGQAVASAISTKADLSMFTAMSESEYEQLVTKTNPLYFIYED
jgi:hypothetical protein